MATLLALFSNRSFRCRSRLRLLSRFFNAQTDTALAINFQNFNRYFLIHLQVIGHFLNTFVGDLRNVYQTFFTAADGNKCAKVNDTGHFTIVDAAHFDFRSDLFDTTNRVFRFFAVGRCNLHSTIIFDFDSGARFFGQGADNRTTFTDNVFDLVRVDLNGMDTRGKLRDIAARRVDRLFSVS